MSETQVQQTKTLNELISAAGVAEIDEWIAKYPADRKRSAVMTALRVAQDENGGYLNNELIEAVADYLEISHIAAYEVATFYSMYILKPVGKTVLSVCTNISCMLRGSDEVLAHLKEKLGIGIGETTEDGAFTIREVECLAACANAPMMQIGRDYHEDLTPEKIDSILANCRNAG